MPRRLFDDGELSTDDTPMQLIADPVQSMATREPQTIMAAFGTNVRMLRMKRGISRLQLANLLGLDEAQVAEIEAGTPDSADLDIIIRIKTCLRVTYHDLVCGNG